jgi:hypothetical protein
MSWITITADDVKNHIAADEYAAVVSVALSAGQPSPVPTVIADVIAEVRGAVSSCAANTLEDDATLIPPSLKTTALDIIVARLGRRLPGSGINSEDRRGAEKDAIRRLERVASCELAVEQAADPVADSGNTADWNSDTRIDL